MRPGWRCPPVPRAGGWLLRLPMGSVGAMRRLRREAVWREGDEEEDQAVSGGHGGQPGSRKMLKQHYLKIAFLEKIKKY